MVSFWPTTFRAMQALSNCLTSVKPLTGERVATSLREGGGLLNLLPQLGVNASVETLNRDEVAGGDRDAQSHRNEDNQGSDDPYTRRANSRRSRRDPPSGEAQKPSASVSVGETLPLPNRLCLRSRRRITTRSVAPSSRPSPSSAYRSTTISDRLGYPLVEIDPEMRSSFGSGDPKRAQQPSSVEPSTPRRIHPPGRSVHPRRPRSGHSPFGSQHQSPHRHLGTAQEWPAGQHWNLRYRLRRQRGRGTGSGTVSGTEARRGGWVSQLAWANCWRRGWGLRSASQIQTGWLPE